MRLRWASWYSGLTEKIFLAACLPSILCQTREDHDYSPATPSGWTDTSAVNITWTNRPENPPLIDIGLANQYWHETVLLGTGVNASSSAYTVNLAAHKATIAKAADNGTCDRPCLVNEHFFIVFGSTNAEDVFIAIYDETPQFTIAMSDPPSSSTSTTTTSTSSGSSTTNGSGDDGGGGGGGGVNKAAIIAPVLVGLLILFIMAFWLWRKRRRDRTPAWVDPDVPGGGNAMHLNDGRGMEERR